GRYIRGHIEALHDAGAVESVVYNPAQAPFDRELLPAGITVRPNTPNVLRSVAATGPGIYQIPSLFEPSAQPEGVVPPHRVGRADVVSVALHDVIAYLFPDLYQRDAGTRAFFRRREHLVRGADLVLTNSEATRRDGIATFDLDPGRVVVIGAGASEFFGPATD